MVRREILAVLKTNEKGAKSLKPERPHPPKLVSMHFTSTSTCINFLSWFYFLTPMDYSPWSEGRFWLFWRQMKKGQNLRNRRSHAHQIWFPCISLQPLPAWIFWADSNFWPPWTIVHGTFTRFLAISLNWPWYPSWLQTTLALLAFQNEPHIEPHILL